jgi:hypothetical protein
MNYFVLLDGFLYLGASAYSLWQGHGMWSFVWLSYGTITLVLALLEGK